jgi:hypothetical protein
LRRVDLSEEEHKHNILDTLEDILSHENKLSPSQAFLSASSVEKGSDTAEQPALTPASENVLSEEASCKQVGAVAGFRITHGLSYTQVHLRTTHLSDLWRRMLW